MEGGRWEAEGRRLEVLRRECKGWDTVIECSSPPSCWRFSEGMNRRDFCHCLERGPRSGDSCVKCWLARNRGGEKTNLEDLGY